MHLIEYRQRTYLFGLFNGFPLQHEVIDALWRIFLCINGNLELLAGNLVTTPFFGIPSPVFALVSDAYDAGDTLDEMTIRSPVSMKPLLPTPCSNTSKRVETNR
jgi:hypothetical protein